MSQIIFSDHELAFVAAARSVDDAREALRYTKLVLNGNATLVATDTHRLHLCTQPYEGEPGEFRVLDVPLGKKGVPVMAPVPTSPWPDCGAFPPYERVIPTEFGGCVSFKQGDMVLAIKAIVAFDKQAKGCAHTVFTFTGNEQNRTRPPQLLERQGLRSTQPPIRT